MYILVYWNLHCCSTAMHWVNCQTCVYHCPIITIYHVGSDTLGTDVPMPFCLHKLYIFTVNPSAWKVVKWRLVWCENLATEAKWRSGCLAILLESPSGFVKSLIVQSYSTIYGSRRSVINTCTVSMRITIRRSSPFRNSALKIMSAHARTPTNAHVRGWGHVDVGLGEALIVRWVDSTSDH